MRVFVIMMTALFASRRAFGGGQRAARSVSDESSPLVPRCALGTFMPFQGNALLFPLMALVCLAIMVYFLREARDGFHWFKTCVAPIIGAGGISFAVYLMMKNRAGITFGVYEGWVKAVPSIALGHLPRRLRARGHLPLAVEGTLRGGREVRPRGGLTARTLIV